MWSAAASSSSQRSSSEGRSSPAPWRRRGLRLQAVPHCRLPSPAAFLHKYELGAQLGRGNFGIVWEARERSTDRIWAAKVVAKSSNKLKMLLLSREIQVLKMVEHPNIVYLREIFETPENVYLMLELCEHGELATFCRQTGKISEAEARTIISGIANAIQYLHKHGIVHRDLKLENVLLASPPSPAAPPAPAAVDSESDGAAGRRPCAKLSDFGLAEVKDKRDHDHMMELFCGTPYCMAPEILSERAYSQQCDVWSMGVILYTLLAGSSPYLGGSEQDVLYSIHRHPHLQDDPALETVTAGARDLLTRMLHLDPAYRITAAEVVAHPWIMDTCTQASASQDILTLMKEWRIEAAVPAGDLSGETRAPEETSVHTQPQTTALSKPKEVQQAAGGTGGQTASGGGPQSDGGGGGPTGCAARQTASRGGGQNRRQLRDVTGSDSTVRPASSSSAPVRGGGRRTPLPARPHQSVHGLCSGATPSPPHSGPRPAPSRPHSGPRYGPSSRPCPTRPPARPGGRQAVAVTGARRRSEAGVPPRPEGGVTPDTWVRPNRRQRANGQQRADVM